MVEIHGPRQVVLITCRYEDKDNILPVAWHTPLSFKPELYGIVIGKTRYSYELIKKSRAFCINFISPKEIDLIIKTGSSSGRNMDKFKAFGIKKEECRKINCCRLKNLLAYLECKVINEVDTGDHVMFVAKVVEKGFFKKGERIFHITANRFAKSTELTCKD